MLEKRRLVGVTDISNSVPPPSPPPKQGGTIYNHPLELNFSLMW